MISDANDDLFISIRCSSLTVGDQRTRHSDDTVQRRAEPSGYAGRHDLHSASSTPSRLFNDSSQSNAIDNLFPDGRSVAHGDLLTGGGPGHKRHLLTSGGGYATANCFLAAGQPTASCPMPANQFMATFLRAAGLCHNGSSTTFLRVAGQDSRATTCICVAGSDTQPFRPSSWKTPTAATFSVRRGLQQPIYGPYARTLPSDYTRSSLTIPLSFTTAS